MDENTDFETIEKAMQSPLRSATDDEIFDELQRRNKAVVLLFLDRDSDDDTTCRQWYGGGFYTCLGMVQQFIHCMMNPEDRE